MSRVGLLSIVCLLLSLCSVVLAQGLHLPQDFEYSDRANWLLDGGLLWRSNSYFHPFILNRTEIDSLANSSQAPKWVTRYLRDYSDRTNALRDSTSKYEGISYQTYWALSVLNQIGPNRRTTKPTVVPEFWANLQYNKQVYLLFHARVTSNDTMLPHYSGAPRKIARFGLRSAEVDEALLGYENSWFRADFGRSRESWGPLQDNNLALSRSSPAYERLLLQFTHRSFRYRWFYGYLETTRDTGKFDVNRYIIGRTIEYSNRKNLVLSLSEISILSGPNRDIDISFLNPFAEHVEIESNRRDNSASYNYSNSVFFGSFDWLPYRSLRVSGTFGADEYQMDERGRDSTAEALLYFGRIAWTPIRNPLWLTIVAQAYRVDTYSLQHSYRWDNLITRGRMIGPSIGNDADDFSIGVRVVPPYPVAIEAAYGRERWGDNSIKNHPYTSYPRFVKLPFPSGTIRTNYYLKLHIESNPLNGLTILTDSRFDLANNGPNSALENTTITMRYGIPFDIFSKDEGTN